MATLSLSAISAVLSLIFMDPMADQFRRDVVLPNLLRVKTGRNAVCTWKAKFDARATAAAFAEGADMSDGDFDSHDRAQASLAWAQYRSGAKVSGLAQAVAAATGDGDLLDEEVVDAIDELAVKLGSHSYAGNPGASPAQFAGAALAIDGSAGTFAGIATADQSTWVAGENSIATADLSKSNLRTKLLRPVKDALGRDPEFVTCPGAIYDMLKDLVDEKASTVQVVTTRARGKVEITAIAGVRAIVIDGVPYIEDRHCTASTLYAWDSSFVEYQQMPVAWSKWAPARLQAAIKALTGVDVEISDIEAALRLMGQRLTPTIDALAMTGDAFKCQVKVYAQIAWRRRNAFAKLALT